MTSIKVDFVYIFLILSCFFCIHSGGIISLSFRTITIDARSTSLRLVLTCCPTILLPFIVSAKRDEGKRFALHRGRPSFSPNSRKPQTHSALHTWQFAVADNRWHQSSCQAIMTFPACVRVHLCQKWTGGYQRGAPCEGEGAASGLF